MTIDIRHSFDVELVNVMGSDEMICRAARVSTLGAESINTTESLGLIRFLMKNRHGSPFEHTSMTFRIKCPIFVWREFMRHRIGFSYNEQSGRYMELAGEFYIPPPERPLQQVGKAGHYTFEPGDEFQLERTPVALMTAYAAAWEAYRFMLATGVAKEVARMCLPVATYSSAYVTCNARSLMAFLSLRTKHEDSAFPSYPQWEIQEVARRMEAYFANEFPLTVEAFNEAGRLSP